MQILSGNFSYTHNYRTHENFAKHVLNLRKKLFKFGEISSSALDCFRSQHSFFLKSVLLYEKVEHFYSYQNGPLFFTSSSRCPLSLLIELYLVRVVSRDVSYSSSKLKSNQIKEFLIKFEKFRKLIVNQFW